MRPGLATKWYIDPDDKTLRFMSQLTDRPFDVVRSDSASEASETLTYDVSGLEPQVAASPSGTRNTVMPKMVKSTVAVNQ